MKSLLILQELFGLSWVSLSAPNIRSDLLLLLLSVPIGYILGLLINYLADVLPASRRLTRPACPVCNQPYSIKDYLLIRRCNYCEGQRSLRWIVVLIISILGCVLLTYFSLPGLGFWGSLPILVFLGVIAVIDIEHRLVLIETSLFGLALCFIYAIILRGFVPALTGGLGGFLVMFTLFLLGIVFSKIVGKIRGRNISQVAFGFGDVFAGAFLGLLTGWPLIAGAIVIGMLAFAAYSLVYIAVLLVTKRYSAFSSALPLAPFLILGAVVILYL